MLVADAGGIKRPLSGIFAARDSVRARLARNTLWITSGSAVSQGLTLLTATMLARILGVSRFGQLALVQSTVLMIGTFGEMGATLTTTKFVSSWRMVDPKRTGRLLGFGFMITGASGLASTLVLVGLARYSHIAGFGGLSREIQAASGLLLFDMLNRLQFGALAGLEAFAASARVQLIRGLLTVLCVSLGARWGGLFGAVLAMGLVSLITFAIGHWILRHSCKSASIPLTYNSKVQLEVLTTSVSLWASSLLLTGSTWIVTVLLSRQPQGLAQLGLYNAADKWKTAVLFLPQMLFQVILPMLSRSQTEKDYRACRRIVHVTFASTIGVTGAAAAFVLLFAKPLMSLYGRAFLEGAGVLSLAAVVAVVSGVYTVGSGALWALGKPTEMLKIDIAKAVLLVVLCCLGFAANAWSLMLANLVTFSAGCLIVALAVYRQLECQKA